MLSKRILVSLLFTAFLASGCARVQKVTLKPGETEPAPVPVVIPSSGSTLTLAFVGDIMMGGSAAHKLKTEGPDSFFTYTAPLLKQADIAMGNLEGPLGLKGKQAKRKKFTFLVDPSAAEGLSRAGFKLMTLANNHTMDFGVEALESTLETLGKAGLQHAGAGMNLKEAREPAWFDMKGKKVAVLAYSLTQPQSFWATEKRPGCAPAYNGQIKEDIETAKTKGADLVVVCCHWGREKHTKLQWYQPSLAHLAIESGADAVVSHHPHIWQELEVYQGKPIAYSIGNFAFGSLSTSTVNSGILYLSFDDKNHWAGGKILPLNVNNYQVRFAAQPMEEKRAEKFYDYLRDLSKTADLSRNGIEITWKAPPFVPSPTPTITPTPEGTPEPEDNPRGSVPGLTKP